MAGDVKKWCATQIAAVCAPKQAFDVAVGLPEKPLETNGDYTDRHDGLPRGQYILQYVYPHLLRMGYSLPLNVVMDLTCAYLDGLTVDFRPPETWPSTAHRDLVESYCAALSEANCRGDLRETITQCRRSRRRRQRNTGNEAADPLCFRLGETAETAGLLTFLELAAAELHFESSHHFSHYCNGEVDRIAGLQYAALQHAGSTDSTAVRSIGDFLQRHFDSQSDGQANPFSQIFGCLSRSLLASAGAETASGADGLDYPVLQACFNYESLELSPEQVERWTYVRRTLRAHENRRARSAESGYHGISNKGTIPAVLRSYLARDDFVDRMYLNQVLYLERHAPRKERRRVLLVWVIDRGPHMQVRTTARYRRDTAARQLVAWMMEDAVRHFADLPVLDLRVAIIMHDGGQRRINYNAQFQPPPEVIAKAPSAFKKQEGIWMPKIPGSMWTYFLRQPIWLQYHDARKPMVSESKAHHRIIALLPKIIRRPSLIVPSDDDRHGFDFCNVVVVGPSSTTQSDGSDAFRAALLADRMAAQTQVSYMLFNEQNITWVSPPGASGAQEAADDYRRLPLNGKVRKTAWDELVGQLSAL